MWEMGQEIERLKADLAAERAKREEAEREAAVWMLRCSNAMDITEEALNHRASPPPRPDVAAERLRKIVRDAKGDDLERAELAKESHRRAGSTAFNPGMPWDRMLEDYRRQRDDWQAASDLLERLLSPPPRPALERREELGRIAWEAHHRDYGTMDFAGTWEEKSEPIKEHSRRIADAVASAIGTPRPAAIVVQDFGLVDAFGDVDSAEDYAEVQTHERAFEVITWRWHPATPAPATGGEEQGE